MWVNDEFVAEASDDALGEGDIGLTAGTFNGVAINGTQVPLQSLSLDLGEGRVLSPDHVSADRPLAFPLRMVVTIRAGVEPLPLGKHEIEIAFEARPFGKLKLSVEDAIVAPEEGRVRIPRDPADDYSDEIVRARQAFVEQFTGVKLQHVSQYSFDPHVAKGNCEHFTSPPLISSW